MNAKSVDCVGCDSIHRLITHFTSDSATYPNGCTSFYPGRSCIAMADMLVADSAELVKLDRLCTWRSAARRCDMWRVASKVGDRTVG